MKNKKIVLAIAIIIAVMAIGIIFFMNKDKEKDNNISAEVRNSDIILKETEKTALRNEIENLNEKLKEKNSMKSHEVTEIFDRSILSGNAGKYEKAAKEYIKDANEALWIIAGVLSDDEISNLYTVQNINKDGPKFKKTISYIKDSKKKLNDSYAKISKYLDSEYFDKYYKKKNLGESNKEFFKEITIGSKGFLRSSTIDTIRESVEEAQELLDLEVELFELLKENSDKWNTDKGYLKFTDKSVENKYLEIVTKMK